MVVHGFLLLLLENCVLSARLSLLYCPSYCLRSDAHQEICHLQSFRISLCLPLCFQRSPPLCRLQVMLQLLTTPYKAPHSQAPTFPVCDNHSVFLKLSYLELTHFPIQLAPLCFHLLVHAAGSDLNSSIPPPSWSQLPLNG